LFINIPAASIACVKLPEEGERSAGALRSRRATVCWPGTNATWEDATRRRLMCDTWNAACVAAKIILHSGSLVRSIPPHWDVGVPCSSRAAAPGLVILRPRFFTFATKSIRPSRFAYPSKVPLPLLRQHHSRPTPYTGRSRSARRRRPSLRTRFWETSTNTKEHDRRSRQVNQFGQGLGDARHFVRRYSLGARSSGIPKQESTRIFKCDRNSIGDVTSPYASGTAIPKQRKERDQSTLHNHEVGFRPSPQTN